MLGPALLRRPGIDRQIDGDIIDPHEREMGLAEYFINLGDRPNDRLIGEIRANIQIISLSRLS